jgi:hypothetical protein
MTDGVFAEPFIDRDEWRDEPLRHRYVHGGFAGTDTLFSIYLPPPSRYGGRFLNHLQGGWGGDETDAAGPFGVLRFAVEECGAFVVESNQGRRGGMMGPPLRDLEICHYQANEAAARFAIKVATEMYGREPHHGYLCGPSGGALRTITGMEQVGDLWAGGVGLFPGITAEDFCIFSHQSVGSDVIRVFGSRLTSVIDAVEPGGSGDPLAGLHAPEREVLSRAFQLGWAPRALVQLSPNLQSAGITIALMGAVATYDPTFYEDFWNEPGYPGTEGKLAGELLDQTLQVSGIVTGEKLAAQKIGAQIMSPEMMERLGMFPIAFKTRSLARPELARFANLRVLGGAAVGLEMPCVAVANDQLVGIAFDAQKAKAIVEGDAIGISNRNFLAWCHYHRYYPDWRAGPGRGEPRRSGYQDNNGLPMTGRFNGKLILIPAIWDKNAPTIGAVRYAELVAAAGTQDNFRMWIADSAIHGSPTLVPEMATRAIDPMGLYEQALKDVIDWVEAGKEPQANTGYAFTEGQTSLAESPVGRGGIQPLVSATINGGSNARVEAGTLVTLQVSAETPPGTGSIISVEWDFEGTGVWPHRHEEIDGTASKLTLSAVHVYKTPGTYFPAVRINSHRSGDRYTRFCRCENLARVRVTVT